MNYQRRWTDVVTFHTQRMAHHYRDDVRFELHLAMGNPEQAVSLSAYAGDELVALHTIRSDTVTKALTFVENAIRAHLSDVMMGKKPRPLHGRDPESRDRVDDPAPGQRRRSDPLEKEGNDGD